MSGHVDDPLSAEEVVRQTLGKSALIRIRELEAINAQITRHRDQLAKGIEHVICDSPGTPETVKGYLREVLRGEQP